MALTMFQLKRWIKMISGRSIDHVNQDLGKCFTTDSLSGYYNNLTEKVTKSPIPLESDELPTLITEKKERVYFPVGIFQYGLGAYDLYIQTDDRRYLRRFFLCADWALTHQDRQGRWNNFFFYSPDTPYGAMAQGEGASLLIRAYKESGEKKYLDAAKRALDFMLLPLEEGGTTNYENDRAYLMEYTFKGMVLNGAIFAWWGLYDYVCATNDSGFYKNKLQQTLDSIIFTLPSFRNRYWSMYSLDGLIASPFYHNLHIAQMQAMYKLTNEEIFNKYAIRWRKQQKNVFCHSLAFVIKAIQKITEK